MYEHTEVLADSDGSEDLSRLPPDDTGITSYGVDVDLQMNNGIIDEIEEFDKASVKDTEDNIVDNIGHSHDIETNLNNLEETGMNSGQVSLQKQVAVSEGNSTNEEVTKEVEVIERSGKKETMEMEDEKSSDDETTEGQIKVLPEDDYSDETTELDKLLQDNNSEVKLEQKKTRNKTMTSGAHSNETEPLLNTSPSTSSRTPSPGAEDLLQRRKQYTPKGYPGKAVKSVAIGTDDDYPSYGLIKERQSGATPEDSGKKCTEKTSSRQNIENEVKTPSTIRISNSTRTPRSKRSQRSTMNEIPSSRSSHSSDATFFKSRLPQTSKRHPKRHVWLVRDSEIHRLIAEKAVILRRYKEDGIIGEL